MRALAVSFVSGLVFAAGLALSGMTDPRKIVAFLDVTGSWDPSLAFVMIGAVGVHFGVARWANRAARRGGHPLWARRFVLPTLTALDPPLLAGAALFGLGWGVNGFCPGPAVVAAASGSVQALVFFGAMLAGTAIFQGVRQPRSVSSRAEITG